VGYAADNLPHYLPCAPSYDRLPACPKAGKTVALISKTMTHSHPTNGNGGNGNGTNGGVGEVQTQYFTFGDAGDAPFVLESGEPFGR